MNNTKYITIWLDKEFFPTMRELVNHISAMLNDRLIAAYPEKLKNKQRQINMDDYKPGKYVVYAVSYLNSCFNYDIDGESS